MRSLATLATLLLGLAATAALVVIGIGSVHAGHRGGGTGHGGGSGGITLGDLSCTEDQIAKYDGTNWVCSADTDTVGALGCSSGQVAKFSGGSGAWECVPDEIGGDSFVVVDDTGQIIRHLTITDNARSALVAVDVQFLGETVTVMHEVLQNRVDDNRTISFPRYESPNCSGQPFYSALSGSAPSSMLPSWRESVIVIDPFAAGSPNMDARLIFFIDRSQIIPLLAMGSFIIDGGGCLTQGQVPQFSIPITEDQFSDDRDDFHVLFPPPYRICPADDFDCITGP